MAAFDLQKIAEANGRSETPDGLLEQASVMLANESKVGALISRVTQHV